MTALLVAGLACAGPTPAPAPASVAPWLREDPQRCLLLRDLTEDMETMAQRCAEEFVRENGYTVSPATDDSTRWVLEVGEGGAWPRVFASREGTLADEATSSQCSMRQCLVLFRLRRQLLVCAYRAVTMSQVFTRLKLEPGGIRDMRCGDRRA
ncbi:MAG: hypothetical protein H0T68_08810 [Gemmatimonadales bacterium]|nr:hypothetical protein [Gemmatimonadales bacterium]